MLGLLRVYGVLGNGSVARVVGRECGLMTKGIGRRRSGSGPIGKDSHGFSGTHCGSHFVSLGLAVFRVCSRGTAIVGQGQFVVAVLSCAKETSR